MTWTVFYDAAFRAWVATATPSDSRIDLVSEWLTRAEIDGPPSNSVQVVDDLYSALIEGAAVRASFLAIMQDRFMLVKEFR